METILEGTPILSEGNRFPYCIELQKIDSDDEIVPADGETVEAFLAESEGGDPIANTEVTLTERAGAPGTYAGEVAGNYVNDVLELGRSAYWVCYFIASETLTVWARVSVQKRRRAT